MDDGLEYYADVAEEHENWSEAQTKARCDILKKIYNDNPDRKYCDVCEIGEDHKQSCEWRKVRAQVYEAGEYYAHKDPLLTFANVRNILYTWTTELFYGRKLGFENRKTLPICVEIGIKMAYRSSSNEAPETFVGFQHAKKCVSNFAEKDINKKENTFGFLPDSNGSTYTGISQETIDSNFTVVDPMSVQRNVLVEFDQNLVLKPKAKTIQKVFETMHQFDEYDWGNWHSPQKLESFASTTNEQVTIKQEDNANQKSFTAESRIKREQEMLDEYGKRIKRIKLLQEGKEANEETDGE